VSELDRKFEAEKNVLKRLSENGATAKIPNWGG